MDIIFECLKILTRIKKNYLFLIVLSKKSIKSIQIIFLSNQICVKNFVLQNCIIFDNFWEYNYNLKKIAISKFLLP